MISRSGFCVSAHARQGVRQVQIRRQVIGVDLNGASNTRQGLLGITGLGQGGSEIVQGVIILWIQPQHFTVMRHGLTRTVIRQEVIREVVVG